MADKEHLRGLTSDFDGNRQKGRTFLNQCELYIKLCQTDFVDEMTMIHWALSYMKSGCMAMFAEEIVSHEMTEGLPRFDTWLDFCKEFKGRFCLLDKVTTAINHLESTAYFQGRCELDDYIDEINELLRRSEYKDKKVRVIKFRWGLDPKVQEQIACKEKPSSDDNLKAWKAAAHMIDQNCQANDAFQANIRMKPKAMVQPVTTQFQVLPAVKN
jgi:hypothetical protein